jgi:glycosyltransferase involved in cell wall biosynthesis
LQSDKFKKGINIICVANLRPQKNHGNLLRAFKIVAAQKSGVFLHLLGVDPGNEYSKSLMDLMKEAPTRELIHYWGPKLNVNEWLNGAQIGVLSSDSEGLPMALLEYGAARLAVVTTAVGQIREVLKEGANGILVPANDEVALAGGLLELINNESLRAHFADALFREVHEKYSTDVINEIITIYNKVLNLN